MKSRDRFRLSTIVGVEALLAAVFYFGALSILVLPLHVSIGGASSLSLLAVTLGSTGWKLFRKLQVAGFNRGEARAAAIAFVVCFPISLSIALAPYEIHGIIAGSLLPKGRVGFLILLFVETTIIGAFLTVLGCALALWIIRRTEKAESHDQLAPKSTTPPAK